MTEEGTFGPQGQYQNCGAQMAGPFCHHCGQEAGSAVRFFGSLVAEFFRETISLDSRVMRTLLALIVRPGYLTNAYLRGQRRRFVPPLRLFLFTSLVCIFTIWLLNVTGERGLVTASPVEAANVGEMDPAQEPADRIIALDGNDLSLDFPWLSEEDNRRLEARLEKSVEKIRSDSNDFANDVLENIPQTTLLLVPLFALLMKLAYPFAGRYYVEHLIHTLYGHAFLFLAVLLLIGLEFGDTRLSASAAPALRWLGHLLGFLEALLFLWLPAYFLLSLRVVYGQSWRMTVWKGLCLGVLYYLLFLVGLAGLLLVSILVT